MICDLNLKILFWIRYISMNCYEIQEKFKRVLYENDVNVENLISYLLPINL